MLKFKSSCKPFLSIKSSNLWLESDSNPSPLIRVHTSVLRYFSQWHCCPKLFCLDHITRGSTQGRLCFCITSLKTTSLNPLPFIASPPPKCLFFFFFYISSRVLITAVEIYMLGRRVAWSHTVGASIFHWAFCLLSFFISKPSPLEPSPLLTIKDVPSPPPPTPPILSHDPVPLLMWDSYVTSQAN